MSRTPEQTRHAQRWNLACLLLADALARGEIEQQCEEGTAIPIDLKADEVTNRVDGALREDMKWLREDLVVAADKVMRSRAGRRLLLIGHDRDANTPADIFDNLLKQVEAHLAAPYPADRHELEKAFNAFITLREDQL